MSFTILYISLHRQINCLIFNLSKMGKDSEFYRIKMTYQGEKEDGGLDTIKSEDLVMAVNYTDAEKIAFKLMEDKAIDDMESVKYEIIKTKITDVIYNNTFVTDVNLIGGLFMYYFEEGESTEVGLYSVQVIYIELKENGKEKRSTETLYIPATTPQEAASLVNSYLKDVGETRNWIIRNVKFDKAQTVLVTKEKHQKDVA